MFPPSLSSNFDIEALSGICGSISIACWIVVFSPQIIENFRRRSADGLSVVFIIIWLVGDVFNIIGAVAQGVLPTMIILALYHAIADIVLLGQLFYYRGFTLTDEVNKPETESHETEPLLGSNGPLRQHEPQRRGSLTQHLTSVDSSHLSPATPLIDARKFSDPPAVQNIKPTSTLQAILLNTFSILLVCAAGTFGWWVSSAHDHGRHVSDEEPALPQFDVVGQVFGWLCAAFYLGSRVPQLVLNYRRKSTEGVALLFFLFACIGNMTYVMSIFAYNPTCHHPIRCGPGEAVSIYGRYILVNASWIVGSAGTLLLDMGIFIQFFMYRQEDDFSDDEEVFLADEQHRNRNHSSS